jgi:hypothetical protein
MTLLPKRPPPLKPLAPHRTVSSVYQGLDAAGKLKWQNSITAAQGADVFLPGSAGTYSFVSPLNSTLTAAYVNGTGGACGMPNCTVAVGGLVTANRTVSCSFTCDDNVTSATVSFGLNGVVTTSSPVTVTNAPVRNGTTSW